MSCSGVQGGAAASAGSGGARAPGELCRPGGEGGRSGHQQGQPWLEDSGQEPWLEDSGQESGLEDSGQEPGLEDSGQEPGLHMKVTY